MTVIRHTEARRTETPGGVMTTLASPSQGGAPISVWHVEVAAHATGPVHAIDADQIWTVLGGHLRIELDGTDLVAAAGDTVVLPAERTRQIHGGTEGFTAIVAGSPHAKASTPTSGDAVTPPWIV
ncbi:cupin domain-containing protein [Nocardia callitridis]|uniref:Cupin domain-containing protein n=1 Tax=Nocardia callitridis TaxID=648753 RepID=A0ABP9KK56_9NOCA